MANLGWVHWDAVKKVFRYLRGKFEYCLCYHGYPTRPRHSVSIHGYLYVGNLSYVAYVIIDVFMCGRYDCANVLDAPKMSAQMLLCCLVLMLMLSKYELFLEGFSSGSYNARKSI